MRESWKKVFICLKYELYFLAIIAVGIIAFNQDFLYNHQYTINFLAMIFTAGAFIFLFIEKDDNEKKYKDEVKRTEINNAWFILAQKSGGNCGKKEALENLVKHGVSLNGITVDGQSEENLAYLNGLKIAGVEMYISVAIKFINADLQNAEFCKVDCNGLEFNHSTLKSAKFIHLNSGYVQFIDTNLYYTKFVISYIDVNEFKNCYVDGVEYRINNNERFISRVYEGTQTFNDQFKQRGTFMGDDSTHLPQFYDKEEDYNANPKIPSKKWKAYYQWENGDMKLKAMHNCYFIELIKIEK
jgi:uncharacterized protein YjbI with pentapeptide repeats